MEQQSNNSYQTEAQPHQTTTRSTQNLPVPYTPVIPQPPPPPISATSMPTTSLHEKWRTWLVPLYALLLLSLAFLGGTYLYEWSLNRIINSASLPEVTDSTPIVNPDSNNVALAADGHTDKIDNDSDSGFQTVLPGTQLPRLNILLLGTDERGEEDELLLTDTMILVTLDRQNRTAGMLSLPRDLWVPFANYDITSKINTAYAVGENRGYKGGGGQLAKDTVSNFIGEPVQYYVRLNFRGFVEMVDQINGITIDVPRTIVDDEYPTADFGVETFYLEAGRQHLDGETALKYVRTRHSDDDYGRARRQQQVIRATLDKVSRTDMIPTLIKEAPRLLTTMRSSVETDMPLGKQFELANYMRSNPIEEIKQLVLDSRYGKETFSESGAWILLPDRQKVRDALDDFFTNDFSKDLAEQTHITPANGVADSYIILNDPRLVRLEILNGTDESGVAARTSKRLIDKGWNIMSIGDADRDDYETTMLVNYGLPEMLIQKITEDLDIPSRPTNLPGLRNSTPVDLRIIVGSDMLPSLEVPLAIGEAN